MNSTPLSPGKLPPALLTALLGELPRTDPRLVVGPRVGEDAAVIDMGDRLLIAKSDPITFATDAIGYYAVTVNANDIATMGGTPRWFLATLLLPEQGTTEGVVRDIFRQIRASVPGPADHAGRWTYGDHCRPERPILSGHMLGEVSRAQLVTSAGVQAGDALLLTKASP